MSEVDGLYSIFETELKRGTLTLSILTQLRTPQYGYSLLQILTGKGVEIEAGTLYPMLRRVEKQGILTCTWDTSESRPRKYYVLSETGRALYAHLIEIRTKMNRQITMLMGDCVKEHNWPVWIHRNETTSRKSEG